MTKIVLKLNLHDDKGKKKALKAVTTLSGIDQIAIDMKERKLTVVGTVDVIYLVRKLRKFWPTEILFVGPAEEPERREEAKKEEAKKEDPKEEDPKKEEPEKEEPKKEEPKKAESEKKEEPKRAESEKKEEPKKAESEKPKKKEINPYEQMIMDLVKGYQHTILRLSTLTTYTVQRRIPMLALFAAKISVQQVYI